MSNNKNQDAIPIPPGKAQFFSKYKIETESGAKIFIKKGERPLAIISGDETQRAKAKALIKVFLEKSLILPAIGYTLLEVGYLANINKAKFRFIKYDGDDINAHSRNREQYTVQLMKETKDNSDKQESDLIDSFSKLEISSLPKTSGFSTSKELDSCLNNIYSQLSKADPTDVERREIRLNLFFGRELFSNVGKQDFDVSEWTKFCRTKYQNRTSFQQNAPRVLEKMSLLKKNFKFEEDKGNEITSKDKGSIAIYFDQDSKRRKIKLHWSNEDRLWKVTKYVRDINRVAILDLISGSKAPDCRFLLKTCYNLKFGNKLTKIINEIQSKSSFRLRDGMWFRVKDFDGKLDKVEIRQTMTKRRFFNEVFQISVVSIKQDSDDKLFTQQTTSLKNKSWRSVENIDQNLSLHYDEQEISNTIYQTIEHAREIMKVLS